MPWTAYFDGLTPIVKQLPKRDRTKRPLEQFGKTRDEALAKLLAAARIEERRLFNEHANAELRMNNTKAALAPIPTR